MKTLIALTAAFLLTLPALAHEVSNGPNGGRIADAGTYHLELVTRDRTVQVHLTDSGDRPVPSAGFKGVALLVVDGKSQRVTLVPEGDSHLAGTAAIALPARPKGAVQLTTPDGKSASARFN